MMCPRQKSVAPLFRKNDLKLISNKQQLWWRLLQKARPFDKKNNVELNLMMLPFLDHYHSYRQNYLDLSNKPSDLVGLYLIA